MPYSLQPAAKDLTARMYFPEIIRGLGTLTGHFLRNLFFSRDDKPDILLRGRDRIASDVVTLQYPEEKQPYPPGYRGLHRLVPRADGKPRCVACYMCATICPAQCIYIEAGEYPDDPVEKYPVRFVIDELRCIVCGFCVEACPKDAIRMDTSEHTPPSYERGAQIYDEKRLLRGPAVSYQYDPWLRRGHPGIAPAELERLRAEAQPFHTVATDEASQTPGFSVRALAAEAKARAEGGKR